MAKLSSKDLSIISDLLTYEQWAAKKSQLFSQSIQDPEIQGFCKKLQETHKKHFDAVFNFLNSQ
ncbi:MAG: hypothetical protein ACOC1K_07850 [Nanoarchaeota archaeon]